MTIDGLFDWAVKNGKDGMLTDLDNIDPTRSYIIVRTDAAGNVVPGPDPVGHVAVTQPGKYLAAYPTPMDLTRANDHMSGNPAVQTYESAGEWSGGVQRGLHSNWVIFIQATRVKGVFEITRDNFRKVDPVKLAPLPQSAP